MELENLKILVFAESNEANTKNLILLLQKLNIQFDLKTTFDETLQSLYKEKFDIVFLDITRLSIAEKESFFKDIQNIKGIIFTCAFGPQQETRKQDFDFYINQDMMENYDAMESVLHSVMSIAHKMKSQTDLSGLLIHDIRSPMQSIVSYLELLQNEIFGVLNDGQKQLLKNSLRLQDHILNLLQELADAMMFDNKAIKLEKTKFNLKDLCHDVLQAMWIHADTKNIKISISISDEERLIYADRSALNRVMTNLLTNAIHFTPKDGLVRISCTCSKSDEKRPTCKFKITDSGEGIDKRDTELIFEKFHRLKKAQSTKGLGLGLYIARLFVEAHSGTIGVFNNREGGATFHFQIPI